MEVKRSNTALLIFAERAKVASRKKLLPDGRKNEDLHHKLLRHTHSKAQKTGIPYYWISDEDQKGKTFQEKFYHSIQDIFNLGYDQLIVMGSDTPQISVKVLLDVERNISENSMVIGPSEDGGLYLMGLHKLHFELLRSCDIPWQSGAEAFYIRCIWENCGLSISVLNTLKDIDSPDDYISLKSQLSHTSAYAFLFTSLIEKRVRQFHFQLRKGVDMPQDCFQLRAPPQ